MILPLSCPGFFPAASESIGAQILGGAPWSISDNRGARTGAGGIHPSVTGRQLIAAEAAGIPGLD